MKRILAIILAAVMMLSVTACGGNKKAFKKASEAYDYINAAYEIVEAMGMDVQEAWRAGIYDHDEVLDDPMTYLSNELNFPEDDLADGAAYFYAKLMEYDWENATSSEKQEYKEAIKVMFEVFDNNDEMFSLCVIVVTNAYEVSGKIAEAQENLDNARAIMKEMSEKFSDYEHYPSLKGFYTTTSSFFDYCQSPTGNFDQMKDTVANYKDTARDYKADLSYIFDD